jgi:hypothetical protein
MTKLGLKSLARLKLFIIVAILSASGLRTRELVGDTRDGRKLGPPELEKVYKCSSSTTDQRMHLAPESEANTGGKYKQNTAFIMVYT